MLSTLTLFYFHGCSDNLGRTLNDYRAFTHEEMESIHNYIQWMFPLNEQSKFSKSAPILTKDDIEYVLAKPNRVDILFESFSQYLLFIFDTDNHERIFGSSFDHNHLRISRVIKCLRLFKQSDSANKFFDAVCAQNKNGVLDNAIVHWKEALTKDLWEDNNEA